MHLTRTLLACLVFPIASFSQSFDIDLMGGVCNYQGDLQPKIFTLQNANPAAAVIFKYGLNENFYARVGFSFGSVAAFDAKNREDLQFRNLNFRSGLQELQAGIEYRLFKPERFALTPYVFAGVGVFHFNPYTRYPTDEKVFLRPLSTEGQGLSQYPDRKEYQLYQICIPYGGGIKWQINCNLNVGIELRQTKIFTDYLDDVSSTYVDQAKLLAERGPLAAELAWRGDEFNGRPYPREGGTRGNPGQNDWYYFLGVTAGLSLNDCESGLLSLGGLFNRQTNGRARGKGKNSMGCPRW